MIISPLNGFPSPTSLCSSAFLTDAEFKSCYSTSQKPFSLLTFSGLSL